MRQKLNEEMFAAEKSWAGFLSQQDKRGCAWCQLAPVTCLQPACGSVPLVRIFLSFCSPAISSKHSDCLLPCGYYWKHLTCFPQVNFFLFFYPQKSAYDAPIFSRAGAHPGV